MGKIYVLIEQAIGYGLLKIKSCKSIDDLSNILKERNIDKLLDSIELVQFQPFSSAANAAMNCVDIANGVVSEDLSNLLKQHLSKGKATMVVNDKKLIESLKSANINSDLTFNADSSIIFNLREIRHHFHRVINDNQDHLTKAHIGLGHGYSRIKIKYNVNRSDNMIIQTINLLDQIDKDINTMSMRLREWFGYHYPELYKIASDYKVYARVVQLIKSRAGATEENLDKLEAILQDSAKARAVIDIAKTSMGYELTDEDFLNIGVFADKVTLMIEQRESTAKYLARKMALVAPNFSTLVGDIVAARLIAHAGSLINLAKFPASTIQILGAEKALFRAIKTRSNTPKYGLIFHSTFIGRAAKGDKGRVSRFLAAKISLAVRLDCFMDEPVDVFGKHLRRHVEDQLLYLETGKEPQKNYEMMEVAVKEAREAQLQARLKQAEESNDIKNEPVENGGKKIKKEEPQIEALNSEKKKKKKKKTAEKIKDESVIEVKEEVVTVETSVKKKKKSVKEESMVEVKEESVAVESSEKKKKKKKRQSESEHVNGQVSEAKKVKVEVAAVVESEKPKKKKNKKSKE